MAYADVAASFAENTSKQSTAFQEAGTYINFGAGYISQPQENSVTPTTRQDATATTAKDSPGAFSSVNAGSTVAYITLGVSVLALVIVAWPHISINK